MKKAYIYIRFISAAALGLMALDKTAAAQPHKKDLVYNTFSTEGNTVFKDSVNYMIVLGADWCRYCHIMKVRTLRDTAVVNFTEKHFEVYRWDLDTREDVEWEGRTFSYLPHHNVHELSLFLAQNKLQLPLIVLINKADNRFEVVQGIQLPDAFMSILKDFIK